MSCSSVMPMPPCIWMPSLPIRRKVSEQRALATETNSAARAVDAGAADAAQLVSLAKAKLSDAYCLIASEAVQLHGGIGMTDEHDIGFFLKRARASEMTFGDAAYHRDRFAELCRY